MSYTRRVGAQFHGKIQLNLVRFSLIFWIQHHSLWNTLTRVHLCMFLYLSRVVQTWSTLTEKKTTLALKHEPRDCGICECMCVYLCMCLCRQVESVFIFSIFNFHEGKKWVSGYVNIVVDMVLFLRSTQTSHRITFKLMNGIEVIILNILPCKYLSTIAKWGPACNFSFLLTKSTCK